MSAKAIQADWPAPKAILAGTTLRGVLESESPLPPDPCWLNQVHGAQVVPVAAYDRPPDADASIGRKAGHVCAIRTADCLPVLLCSENGGEIAAAHCGWRGLAAGVLENTIEKMTSRPDEIMAWFGPAISQASFEVGDEVRAAFVEHDSAATVCFTANDRGRWQCDLYGLARRRLAAALVTRVYGGEYCTYRDEERFYSYRRDPGCGRMVSFVAILGPKKSP